MTYRAHVLTFENFSLNCGEGFHAFSFLFFNLDKYVFHMLGLLIIQILIFDCAEFHDLSETRTKPTKCLQDTCHMVTIMTVQRLRTRQLPSSGYPYYCLIYHIVTYYTLHLCHR